MNGAATTPAYTTATASAASTSAARSNARSILPGGVGTTSFSAVVSVERHRREARLAPLPRLRRLQRFELGLCGGQVVSGQRRNCPPQLGDAREAAVELGLHVSHRHVLVEDGAELREAEDRRLHAADRHADDEPRSTFAAALAVVDRADVAAERPASGGAHPG